MNQVLYSDKNKVDKIMSKIIKEGFNKLHILSDFDNTLTKAFSRWKKRSSLISILRSEWFLWEEYSKKAYELFDYYNPIEINPEINFDEKKKEMMNWRHKHLDLLVKSWLHKNDIKKVIISWIIEFREKTKDLLYNLYLKNIPVLIISANWLWTDSIKFYLNKEKCDYLNIFVISNTFFWDIDWRAVWYDERVIHSFNKWETILESYPEIYEVIKDKKNVILLWDSLWDHYMIDGFDYDNLLKIWFLNDNISELLDEYLKRYDVVITWDWDMSFLNDFIKKCF